MMHVARKRLKASLRSTGYFPVTDFFSGMAEISARNALFTSSDDVKTFAISGSIRTIKGSSFMRAANRFGFALR